MEMFDGLSEFVLMNENPPEVKMGQPVAGAIFDRLAEMFSCLVQSTFPFDHRGVIVMGLGVELIDLKAAEKSLRGFRVSLLPGEHHSIVIVAVGQVGIDGHDIAVMFLGLLKSPRSPVKLYQVDVRLSELRVDFERALVLGD